VLLFSNRLTSVLATSCCAWSKRRGAFAQALTSSKIENKAARTLRALRKIKTASYAYDDKQLQHRRISPPAPNHWRKLGAAVGLRAITELNPGTDSKYCLTNSTRLPEPSATPELPFDETSG